MPQNYIKKFAHLLADQSGKAILPYFRTVMDVENKAAKAKYDPVTIADREAERVMRDLIAMNFPNHGVVGEEFLPHNETAEYVWVLDPIDGTKAFICGLPTWGTLIGLKHNGKAEYGMMHQPFTQEKFWGNNEGAFMKTRLGQSQLKTRECENLANAIISTTSPNLFKGEDFTAYKRVENQCRLARYGADCYAYAMLAAGNIDCVVETGLDPYDIMAIIPIVRGAGGFISTWDGGEAEQGGRIIASGDKRVHEAAMALLK